MDQFIANLSTSPMGDEAVALRQERLKSPFASDELTTHLYKDTGWLERQKRILSILENHPNVSKERGINLGRPERLLQALDRAKLLRKLAESHGWGAEDRQMAAYLFDDVLSFDPNTHVFITTLRQQASLAQKEYWLPLAESYKIIGAYAQTELGHGSNAQGINTQAKWDSATKEFVINTPTLTASKLWIGGLGKTANHAVVVAQLLVVAADGSSYKSHGPHPFVMQIREMDSHRPLKGISIGCIGRKKGYNTMDNGYMLFDNVRVPHSALLSQYARLDPVTSEYRMTPNKRIIYGPMTYIRAQVVNNTRLVLARAVTIAIRCTAVRKQFSDRDRRGSKDGLAFLDYQLVQIRLLPILATVFALHYTGRALESQYRMFLVDQQKGNSDEFAHIHALSSGLRSATSAITADGLEACRRALGRHGFGGGSGFASMIQNYISKLTVEGDNWTITRQTAAYLIKKVNIAVKFMSTPGELSVDLLVQNLIAFKKQALPVDVLSNNEHIAKAFNHRAADLAWKVYYEERVILKKNWNELLVQLHQLVNAYSQAYIVEQFQLALLNQKELSEFTRSLLAQLFKLYAFCAIEQHARDFLNASTLSLSQLNELPGYIQDLTGAVLPHAVKIVDAWQIPDYLLNSTWWI